MRVVESFWLFMNSSMTCWICGEDRKRSSLWAAPSMMR